MIAMRHNYTVLRCCDVMGGSAAVCEAVRSEGLVCVPCGGTGLDGGMMACRWACDMWKVMVGRGADKVCCWLGIWLDA